MAETQVTNNSSPISVTALASAEVEQDVEQGPQLGGNGEAPPVEDRRGYIGGSDAGALLGLTPWRTPLVVFAEKTGRSIAIPPDAATLERQYFGKLLEPSIGQAVLERFGLPVQYLPKDKDFFRSKQYPFMGGHIDFLIADGSSFLECKNVTGRWGDMMDNPLHEDGSHLVPPYYLAQVLHYMVVLDVDVGFIAALLHGKNLRLYRVERERNEAMIAQLIEVERRFWEDYIVPDILPEPVTEQEILTAIPAEQLAQRGRTVTADVDLKKAMNALARVCARKRQTEKDYEKARNQVIVAVSGPAVITDDNGDVIGSVLYRERASLDRDRFEHVAPEAFKYFCQFEEYFKKTTPYFLVRSVADDDEE